MKLILFYLVILPSPLIAQIVQGQVFDDSTGMSLAYVNIGVIGTSIGAVSNEEGYFSIDTENLSQNTKVRFSIIGYISKVVTLEELVKKPSIINLTPGTFKLDEITITKSKLKKTEKGAKIFSKTVVTNWARKFSGGERGIRIKVGTKPIYVKSVHFHIANNEFDEVLVRIHFRKFENEKPSQHIFNYDILVPVKIRSGWVDVKLEDYNLIFEEDIFVTLQPVQKAGMCGASEDYCFALSLGMFKFFSTNWLVYKMSSEAEWKIKKNWSPGIYLTVYE